jgi:hypothetical protein
MAKRKEKYRSVLLDWENPSDNTTNAMPIKIPVRGWEEAMADAVEAGLRFIDVPDDEGRPS